MQLFKSLFCWHGFDNRQRFIVISLSSLLSFIILNESLISYKLSAIVALLLCSSTYLASTLRRLNDAQLHKNWIIAPAGSFLITGLIIIFIGHGGSYWWLMVPLLLALLLLTYPSNCEKHYILGYNGPVNLTDFQQVTKANSRNFQRVEPTMNGIDTNQVPVYQNDHYSTANHVANTVSPTSSNDRLNTNTQHRGDIGETIRLVLFSHKNARLTIAIIASSLLLALLMSLTFGGSPSPAKTLEQTSDIKELAIAFQHQLTLPDNFSIMLSPDNAMVINWQGDAIQDGEIWTLATAIGDKNCENITFNTGTAIRTYSVSAIDNDYYAYFSPLDSKALIKDIAFKNTFSLCGYNFSLKGSQATLGKSPFYAQLIEY